MGKKLLAYSVYVFFFPRTMRTMFETFYQNCFNCNVTYIKLYNCVIMFSSSKDKIM